MRRRCGSTITVGQYVEVEIDVASVIDRLGTDAAKDLARKAGLAPQLAFGAGDQARLRNIIDSAYFAALRIPDCPREIKDLFWFVHERAM